MVEYVGGEKTVKRLVKVLIIMTITISLVSQRQILANAGRQNQEREMTIRVMASLGEVEVRTFRVEFYLQGRGSEETVEYFEIVQEVEYGGRVERPTIEPEYYEYYEFIEWVIGAESEEEFDFEKEIRQDMRIYARWEAMGENVNNETGESPADPTSPTDPGIPSVNEPGIPSEGNQMGTTPTRQGKPSVALPQTGARQMNMKTIGISLLIVAGVSTYLKDKISGKD